MLQDPDRATSAPAPATPDGGAGRGLLPDYNPAAIAYWWLLAVGGALALGVSVVELARMPLDTIGQILAVSAIATVVGMFPLRIPKSKTSIAAGDTFIFLLLLVNGPFAAVIAATAEAAACAVRASSRWSSRIVSPGAAAVSMLACGHLFSESVAALGRAGIAGDGVSFGAILVFAAVYFAVGPTLVTAVIWLKRWRLPTPGEWLTTFGWLGMGYVASASIAGVLFVAFRQFGLNSVLIAVPMIGMFITSLRVYFSQQEASEREAAERASRERAEHAERESAMAAEHLRALELSERRFQSAFAHAAIGMGLVSLQGQLVQVNAALAALLGRTEALLVGTPLRDLVDLRDLPTLEEEVDNVRAGRVQSLRCEVRCRHARGHTVWVSMHGSAFAGEPGTGEHLIVQAFDVTARRLAEDRLQHLAYHDILTDLANRRRLHDSVTGAIELHRSDPSQQFSLLHLSFDRVRLLNDSLGRGVGDQFLVAIARRMSAMMRPGDLLARLEGDDFGILALHRGGGTHQAIALAERLQQAFVAPVIVNDAEVHAGASIGITFSDVGYIEADDTLRDAQLAVAKAKAGGQPRYALFEPSMHELARVRLIIETELRRALDERTLQLAFQPVFAIAPQRLVGFEALARWTHATRGPISPAEFIPVAEQSGLIVPLTAWALRAACRQLAQWRDAHGGAGELFVNVNIAGQDLCEPDFADLVRDTLAEHGLPARCLTLEITETALMQQLEMGKRTLARLRELGVGLSVDDFGTGYSSLSHLSTLPINSLKIDRSFVDRLEAGSVECEIVRAVVQLGQALGKRVIAEGIETTAQLERLQALGCGYAQGFLLARPLGVAQVPDLLAALPPRGARPPAAGADAPEPAAAAATANPRPEFDAAGDTVVGLGHG